MTTEPSLILEGMYHKRLTTPIRLEKMTDLNRYIDFHHEQDCCERVYVDLEHLDAYDAQLVGF